MAIRTAVLARLNPAANTAVVATTVPAAQTYIVKSVLVSNAGGVADNITVEATDSIGAILGIILTQGGLAAQARLDWEGFVVLGPTDKLVVFSSTGASHFWISGAKLPGSA